MSLESWCNNSNWERLIMRRVGEQFVVVGVVGSLEVAQHFSLAEEYFLEEKYFLLEEQFVVVGPSES